jgi:hypothetical protein
MTLSLSRIAWSGVLILAFVLTGCPSKTKSNGIIKGGSPIVVTKKGTKAGGGCVRGRIVNDDNKGFAGVYISTKPTSSLQVTDSFGNFEICHARKVINKDTGETAKVGLPHGVYSLVVKKDGFHSNPVSFAYKGKTLRLTKVLLVEKTKPLPDVKQTKKKEEKRSGGLVGKPPTAE